MTDAFQTARSLAQAGRLQDALDLCRSILDGAPAHVPTLDLAAMILTRGGLHDQALVCVDRLIALVPDAIGPMGSRALLLRALGRPDRAAATYRALLRRGTLDAPALVTIGRGALECGDAATAAEALGRALDLAPRDAGLAFLLARTLIGAGRLADGLPILDRALNLDPAALEASNYAASVLFQIGRADLAATVLSKALAHHPQRAELRQNLAVVLFDLGRADEAAPHCLEAALLDPSYGEAWSTHGQILLRQGHWGAALASLFHAVRIDPRDVQAHMGIYYLAEARGDRALALRHQAAALEIQQVFSEACRTRADAPSILILEAPGDFQANVPTGFFLSTETYHLHRYVLVPGKPVLNPADLPAYDVVFNAISEPDRTSVPLTLAQTFLAAQAKPVINAPQRIGRTARNAMSVLLAGIPDLVVPVSRRVKRAPLADWAAQGAPPDDALDFPVLVRPIGSHAGNDLELARDASQLAAYLQAVDSDAFYVTRFIDYATPADGLFRKYRAIVVDGVPLPCHMAIRDHWMIHYFNARMDLSADKRAEEADFLADMGAHLGPKAMAALAELARRVDIDYFGIDFGRLPDGRLVLFEVDVGAIVHLMDDKEMFAYKHQHVPRIFEAAHAMIARRIARG